MIGSLLILWIGIAATLIHPYAKHIAGGDNLSKPMTGFAYLLGTGMSLLWPASVFLLLRRQFFQSHINAR